LYRIAYIFVTILFNVRDILDKYFLTQRFDPNILVWLQNRLEGIGVRGERCHPSDLLCWLTVIWSEAPTDSLGGGPYLLLFVLKFMDEKNYKVEEKH
jgi:hypothetical protein